MVVVGSAIAVMGWYLMTNRTGLQIDVSGFDLNALPESRGPTPASSGSSSPVAVPQSGLTMVEKDPGIHVGNAPIPAPARPTPAAAAVAAATTSKTPPPTQPPMSADQKKAMADAMNNPEVQKIMQQQQGQQAPPVSLPGLSPH